mmetsp:Transcript_36208/g.107559  ORF Transcript_36208/g.107559 Transcript_36208/m.107559 type:complete len:263 (+) Transcript_36208:913-1701(+)
MPREPELAADAHHVLGDARGVRGVAFFVIPDVVPEVLGGGRLLEQGGLLARGAPARAEVLLQLRMRQRGLRHVDGHGGDAGVLTLEEDLAGHVEPLPTLPHGSLLPHVVGLRQRHRLLQGVLADDEVLEVDVRAEEEAGEVRGSSDRDAGILHVAVEGRVLLQAGAQRAGAEVRAGGRQPAEDHVDLYVAAALVEDRKVHVERSRRRQGAQLIVHEDHLVAVLQHQDDPGAEEEPVRHLRDVEREEHARGDDVGGVREGPRP